MCASRSCGGRFFSRAAFPKDSYLIVFFRKTRQIIIESGGLDGENPAFLPIINQKQVLYRKKSSLNGLFPLFHTTYKRLLLFCRKVFLSFEINNAYVGKPGDIMKGRAGSCVVREQCDFIKYDFSYGKSMMMIEDVAIS